jgi:chloramphenicol-sensitive protein RarD
LCIAAYGLWGLIPFYFRSLGDLPPLEVLAHRVIWSLVFLAALLTLGRRWPQVAQAVRSRRVLGALAASALLIGMNWFTYIGAVMNGQVLQASLGYFITPLVNVLLGVIFLGERLRPLQLAGVLLALAGVLNLALAGAGLPWISLTLAISFAFYGLLRKTTAINSTQGLFVETALLSPLAAGWLGWMLATGSAAVPRDPAGSFPLLVASGIVTTVPLLCFVAAAQRLRFVTLGFLQYLSPTLQFLVAVLAFKEPFSGVQLTTFACIWLAVALYSVDSLWLLRQHRLSRFEPVTVPE